MIAVISVYKVANFPDGGGHFWVYMQYAQGLRRLGCDVYWLEQFRPPASGDSAQEASLLSPFFERMKRFGLEGKTLLYAKAGNDFRFVGCEWPDVERVLKGADLLLNFHYAIDPRLLACARRTALVDIDPGLLQFWISTGQLRVPAHDCYLTTGETVGTAAARFSDCGLEWHRIRPPVCLDLWPFTYDPHAEAFMARAPLDRSGRQPRRLPLIRAALAWRVQLREGVLHAVPERLGERPHALLPGERQAGRCAAHRPELLSPERRRHVPLHLARRGRRRARRDQLRLRAPLPRSAGSR